MAANGTSRMALEDFGPDNGDGGAGVTVVTVRFAAFLISSSASPAPRVPAPALSSSALLQCLVVFGERLLRVATATQVDKAGLLR